MSLSGANADVRHAVKVSELPLVVISLHDHIARKTGGTPVGGSNTVLDATTLKAAATQRQKLRKTARYEHLAGGF